MVTKEHEAPFAVGNFDTSFPTDARFRRMREGLPLADYLAAAGLYWHLVAASWREARRVSIGQEFSEPPADLVAALRRYGLVDQFFKVRSPAFDHWIGKSIRNRALARDRQARFRNPGPQPAAAEDLGAEDVRTNQINPIPKDSPRDIPNPVSRVTPPDSNGPEPGSLHRPRRAVTRDKRVTQTSKKENVGTTYVDPETDENQDGARAAQDDGWVVLASAVEELTGRAYALPSPHSKLGQRAVELVESFGLDATLSALRRAALMVDGGHPDAGQVVLGASNLLRPIPGSRAAAGGQNGDRGHTRPVEEVASAFKRG